MQVEVKRQIHTGHIRKVYEYVPLGEKDIRRTKFLHNPAVGKFGLLERGMERYGAKFGKNWKVKDVLSLLALATVNEFVATEPDYVSWEFDIAKTQVDLLVSDEFYASGKDTYSAIGFQVTTRGANNRKKVFQGALTVPSGVNSNKISGIPLGIREEGVNSITTFGYRDFLDDNTPGNPVLKRRGEDIAWNAANLLNIVSLQMDLQ